MEIGFVGLGRMGYNMSLRLLRAGHQVVVTDRDAARIEEAGAQGAVGVRSPEELVRRLAAPRVVWAMIPAGPPVDELLDHVAPLLERGDVFVDGGNSNFKDSRRRAERLAKDGVHFVDCGTSGGIWGLDLGYCMMLGGPNEGIARLRQALDSLAPPDGWRHVGPAGAGHYAKMIHNGIEYGMMQSYAEGFEILKASDYSFDLAELSHLWNQGSVVRSWLLELAERAFRKDPGLDRIRGYVEDSGEGRWAVIESVERAVPAPVLTGPLGQFDGRR